MYVYIQVTSGISLLSLHVLLIYMYCFTHIFILLSLDFYSIIWLLSDLEDKTGFCVPSSQSISVYQAIFLPKNENISLAGGVQ